MPAVTFEIITLFPGLFSSPLSTSLLGKAIEKDAVTVHFTDLRAHAHDSTELREVVEPSQVALPFLACARQARRQ